MKNQIFLNIFYWEHLQHTENLDMFKIFDKVDHHGYIRIVNYIRGNALKIHSTKEMLCFPLVKRNHSFFPLVFYTSTLRHQKPN